MPISRFSSLTSLLQIKMVADQSVHLLGLLDAGWGTRKLVA
jgi:hypothetical protein